MVDEEDKLKGNFQTPIKEKEPSISAEKENGGLKTDEWEITIKDIE